MYPEKKISFCYVVSGAINSVAIVEIQQESEAKMPEQP